MLIHAITSNLNDTDALLIATQSLNKQRKSLGRFKEIVGRHRNPPHCLPHSLIHQTVLLRLAGACLRPRLQPDSRMRIPQYSRIRFTPTTSAILLLGCTPLHLPTTGKVHDQPAMRPSIGLLIYHHERPHLQNQTRQIYTHCSVQQMFHRREHCHRKSWDRLS